MVLWLFDNTWQALRFDFEDLYMSDVYRVYVCYSHPYVAGGKVLLSYRRLFVPFDYGESRLRLTYIFRVLKRNLELWSGASTCFDMMYSGGSKITGMWVDLHALFSYRWFLMRLSLLNASFSVYTSDSGWKGQAPVWLIAGLFYRGDRLHFGVFGKSLLPLWSFCGGAEFKYRFKKIEPAFSVEYSGDFVFSPGVKLWLGRFVLEAVGSWGLFAGPSWKASVTVAL